MLVTYLSNLHLALQVPRVVTEDVCLDVPVSTPRQECRNVPREECDVIETTEPDEVWVIFTDWT